MSLVMMVAVFVPMTVTAQPAAAATNCRPGAVNASMSGEFWNEAGRMGRYRFDGRLAFRQCDAGINYFDSVQFVVAEIGGSCVNVDTFEPNPNAIGYWEGGTKVIPCVNDIVASRIWNPDTIKVTKSAPANQKCVAFNVKVRISGQVDESFTTQSMCMTFR